jgi:predicted GH43/DUF377 family glycosyl hydrolase
MDVTAFLTPYKYGSPVLTGSGVPGSFDELAVDCPFVFQHNGLFYMMYVGFNGTGYQTALARSDDLLHWQPAGTILRRGEGSGWDSKNVAGTWILRENRIDALPILKKWNDKYWMVYHSYPEDGYEEGPAKIGLAWTEDETLMHWHRLPNPILNPEEGENWEKGGLYKECLVMHEGTFYLFYNAKNKSTDGWTEQTGVAMSSDLHHWVRSASNPILRVSECGWDSSFVSDPCVLQHGDQWVMFFFGYDRKHAQEGVALSGDLLNWNKYPKPILTVGVNGENDSIHAHKPSVITHKGIMYHFYCACRPYIDGDITKNGEEFRTISVAASKAWA